MKLKCITVLFFVYICFKLAFNNVDKLNSLDRNTAFTSVEQNLEIYQGIQFNFNN